MANRFLQFAGNSIIPGMMSVCGKMKLFKMKMGGINVDCYLCILEYA